MKIIDERNIYPDEEIPVLKHYQECFDAVKICFLPFFQLESDTDISSRRAKDKTTFEELKEKDDLFKKIKGVNAEIYGFLSKDNLMYLLKLEYSSC